MASKKVRHGSMLPNIFHFCLTTRSFAFKCQCTRCFPFLKGGSVTGWVLEKSLCFKRETAPSHHLKKNVSDDGNWKIDSTENLFFSIWFVCFWINKIINRLLPEIKRMELQTRCCLKIIVSLHHSLCLEVKILICDISHFFRRNNVFYFFSKEWHLIPP